MFPLKIWKQPHWINCSDKFRVNQKDTHCFEHPHEESTKPSVNVSVSHMLEFSYRLQVFYGFKRGEVRSDGGERDVDVLVAISSPLILVEKSVVNSRSSNPGEMWKITYMRHKTKSISILVPQVLVSSLFYNFRQKWIPFHISQWT